MVSKDELISEAISLPIEIRLQLVEKILEILHTSYKEIDELWTVEAENRVAQIEGESRLMRKNLVQTD